MTHQSPGMGETIPKTRYAVRFACVEAVAMDKSVVTKTGTKAWVCVEPDGWVEATASMDHGVIPQDARTFVSRKAARDFMKRWSGHPWYYRHNGEYEVIPVKKKYRRVFEGYVRARAIRKPTP